MSRENYVIELAAVEDIEEIEKLYHELNDYLESGINYAGWKKNIYPTVETAINGIKNENLFVLKSNNEIVGSIILDNKQDPTYDQIKWESNINEKEVTVVHTLVVSPKHMNQGIGDRLLDFIKTYSIRLNRKTIRLDVATHNKPAISLYEKHGYKCMGTVDLGLINLDTTWFRVYELNLN